MVSSCGTIEHFSVRISWHLGIVPGSHRDFPETLEPSRGPFPEPQRPSGKSPGMALEFREWSRKRPGKYRVGPGTIPGCQEILTLKCSIVPHEGIRFYQVFPTAILQLNLCTTYHPVCKMIRIRGGRDHILA